MYRMKIYDFMGRCEPLGDMCPYCQALDEIFALEESFTFFIYEEMATKSKNEYTAPYLELSVV